MSSSNLALLGLSWTNGTPTLLLRRGDDGPTVEPLIGQHFRLEVDPSGRRWCLGADGPGHTTSPCLAEPEAGGKTCTSCSVKNALFAGALHHAHRQQTSDPEVIKHLDQTNRLYVAAFRDGSMKVGTSTARRSEIRLLEQGAWHARLVATTSNGVTVRVIEDLVTEHLDLPQSVAISRKLAGLTSPRADDWLVTRLDAVASSVHRLLASTDGLSSTGVAATNDSWINPAAETARWGRVHSYPHKLEVGAHEMHIVDAVGSAVVFRRTTDPTADLFVADLRRLFGLTFVVPLDDIEPAPVTVQDQLF